MQTSNPSIARSDRQTLYFKVLPLHIEKLAMNLVSVFGENARIRLSFAYHTQEEITFGRVPIFSEIENSDRKRIVEMKLLVENYSKSDSAFERVSINLDAKYQHWSFSYSVSSQMKSVLLYDMICEFYRAIEVKSGYHRLIKWLGFIKTALIGVIFGTLIAQYALNEFLESNSNGDNFNNNIKTISLYSFIVLSCAHATDLFYSQYQYCHFWFGQWVSVSEKNEKLQDNFFWVIVVGGAFVVVGAMLQ